MKKKNREAHRSVMGDESLFWKYFTAILAGRGATVTDKSIVGYAEQADLAAAEHRKRFPK